MKQNILYLLLGIFLLAGCRQEELPGGESRYGYLSLTSVVAEVENVNAPASRALPAIDTENMYVEICEGEKVVLLFAPGELPEKIQLPVGTYTAKAYNEAYNTFESLENSAMGEPVFYGETGEFAIEGSEEPVSQTVEASLWNSGISFLLSEGFADYFDKESTGIAVSCGDRTVTLKYEQFTGADYAYFRLGEGERLTYTLTSKNADEETVTLSGDLDVENGTCYTLTFNFQPDGAVSAVSE